MDVPNDIKSFNIFLFYFIFKHSFFRRNSNIFDKMIGQLIKNNLDAIIACKEERGSIFFRKDNKVNKINDGEVPFNLRTQDVLTSRIVVAYVI